MSFKRLFAGFLVVAMTALAAPAVAQDAPDPMQAKLDKKLASPFIEKGGWYTDFDKAKKAAADAGKPIFAYFTRSYSP